MWHSMNCGLTKEDSIEQTLPNYLLKMNCTRLLRRTDLYAEISSRDEKRKGNSIGTGIHTGVRIVVNKES